MTAEGFTVSHARDAQFARGLRSFFEYRDLGIENATSGQVVAHVIRAAPGAPFAGQAFPVASRGPWKYHATSQKRSCSRSRRDLCIDQVPREMAHLLRWRSGR